MSEFLILVDENDRQWGKLEKLLVHQLGLLHRAFSVFIFNTKGELLLQQRAESKYHSGGLWTNTCCSHPQFGETTPQAADRRLMEEMGMTCVTRYAFQFMYKVQFPNGLTEHELDHVYIGISDQLPEPDALEVKSWKYIGLHQLTLDIQQFPDRYTEWMKICLPRVQDYFITHIQPILPFHEQLPI